MERSRVGVGETSRPHGPADDPAEVLAALGLPPPVDAPLRLVGGDPWVTMWRVRLPDGLTALRLYAPGADATCRRDAAVMRAALDGGVPVPMVRTVGQHGGRPAMVMDWCSGRTVGEELAANPSRAWALGAACGRTLAVIHTVAAPETLAADPHRSWIDAGGADPLATGIAAHLRALGLREDVLLHLDFHPLNLLTESGRITGVIDWTNAHAGDPRADLARTVSILRLDATRPGVLPEPVRQTLPLYETGLIAAYAEVRGPEDLAPFHAWAAAAMLRDLAGRRDEAFFARVRAYRDEWRTRAGIG